MNKLLKHAGIEKSSQVFRKTFASHIDELTDYNTVILQRLMAHTPDTMARGHYSKTLTQEVFDEIINKLFYSYGIDTFAHLVSRQWKERKRRLKDAQDNIK